VALDAHRVARCAGRATRSRGETSRRPGPLMAYRRCRSRAARGRTSYSDRLYATAFKRRRAARARPQPCRKTPRSPADVTAPLPEDPGLSSSMQFASVRGTTALRVLAFAGARFRATARAANDRSRDRRGARMRRLPAPLARCRRGKAADARGVRGGGIGPPPRHPRGLRSRQVSGARSAVPCSPPRLGHRGVRGRTGWGRGLQADEEEPAAHCAPRTSTPGKSRMSLL
jgi:hypothetical protein